MMILNRTLPNMGSAARQSRRARGRIMSTTGSPSGEGAAAVPQQHHEIAKAPGTDATSPAADLSRYAQSLFTSNNGFGSGFAAGLAAPVTVPYAYISGSGFDSDTPSPPTSLAHKVGEGAGAATDAVGVVAAAAGIWGPDEVAAGLATAGGAVLEGAASPVYAAAEALTPEAESAFVTAGRTVVNEAFGGDVGAPGWSKAIKALYNVTNDDEFTAFLNQLKTEGKDFGSHVIATGEDTVFDLKDSFG
jgi:hypothetical protein